MSNPCYCSFCGKSQHEADVMLAGPVLTFICDTCVLDAVAQIETVRRDRKSTAEVIACAGCIPEPLHV